MKNPVITKSSLAFLKKLAKNNDRDWFAKNKGTYETEYANMKRFKDALGEKMDKYDHIERNRLHRIYRDVRFSKNKLPYKINRGGSFTRATKWRRGGYYFEWHLA